MPNFSFLQLVRLTIESYLQKVLFVLLRHLLVQKTSVHALYFQYNYYYSDDNEGHEERSAIVGNEDDLKPEEGQIKVCVFDLNHSRDMLHISKFAITEASHNEYRNPDEKGQVILTCKATRVASDE